MAVNNMLTWCGQLPTDFWAKIIKIAHPVNYPLINIAALKLPAPP